MGEARAGSCASCRGAPRIADAALRSEPSRCPVFDRLLGRCCLLATMQLTRPAQSRSIPAQGPSGPSNAQVACRRPRPVHRLGSLASGPMQGPRRRAHPLRDAVNRGPQRCALPHVRRAQRASRTMPCIPVHEPSALRSLAGSKESHQWSCIASTGLAWQEVDDSKEVTSLENRDALKVRPGPLSSCSLPCGFA